MKYIKSYNESQDSDTYKHGIIKQFIGDKSSLEDDFINKVHVGISSGVREVERIWTKTVVFKCMMVDNLGMDRNDPLIIELQYRIVEGENPRDVINDIYKRLPKTSKIIDDVYNDING